MVISIGQCTKSPYPLCSYNCGDGAIANESNKCEMITDKEHLELWQQSKVYINNVEQAEGFNKMPYFSL